MTRALSNAVHSVTGGSKAKLAVLGGLTLATGGLGALMEKLPAELARSANPAQIDDRQLKRQVAIIDSMTPRERRRPNIIDGSRKRRIAAGAGVQVQDVNRLLKQFLQMQKTMKQFSKGGFARMLRGMGGRFPRP